jgi:hypothetical protein
MSSRIAWYSAATSAETGSSLRAAKAAAGNAAGAPDGRAVDGCPLALGVAAGLAVVAGSGPAQLANPITNAMTRMRFIGDLNAWS